MARAKKTLEEQVQAQIPEFVAEVVGLSVDQLNVRLAAQAKATEQFAQQQEEDEDLAEKKAAAKEAGAVYRDAKKEIRLKSRYLVKLIKEKGGA